MESIKGTTARLRRTFQYPTDDSSNEPEAMDEEGMPSSSSSSPSSLSSSSYSSSSRALIRLPLPAEAEQETLIQTLADQNTAHNAQYTNLLTVLPLVAALPYLITLFSLGAFLVSVLSLSSLVSTAYLVRVLPPTETGITALDAWV